MRMRTIVHPEAVKRRGPIKPTDYIRVPAITTFGTWPIQDLIPTEQAALLAAYANLLEATKVVIPVPRKVKPSVATPLPPHQRAKR